MEQLIFHPLAPISDERSRVLILGSFPSVQSRGDGFYYANPQNRFWRVLSEVFDRPLPPQFSRGLADPHAQKAAALWLRSLRVALWDVIKSCRITGSKDDSITDVTPNELGRLLDSCPSIERIFLNGRAAQRLYQEHFSSLSLPAVYLPSTSPLNASYSLKRLCESWQAIRGA